MRKPVIRLMTIVAKGTLFALLKNRQCHLILLKPLSTLTANWLSVLLFIVLRDAVVCTPKHALHYPVMYINRYCA